MKLKMIIALSLMLSLTACDSDDKQPEVQPTPTPVVVETPTPVVHPKCPVAQAPTLKCYDWAPCDGLFATFEAAAAILNEKDAGGCNRIDGVVIKSGFGPCSECNTIGRMQAKSAAPSFEEVLKLRDGKTVIEKD